MMAIHCPKCGREHDVVEFEAAPSIRCQCGALLDPSLMETIEDFLRYFENEEELKKAKEIQEDATRICQMILDSNCADIDIIISQHKLREKIHKLFPDKLKTYQMIYEARFKRLWDQFRESDDSNKK